MEVGASQRGAWKAEDLMAYTEPLYPFYDSPQNPTLKIADTLGRIEGMAGPLNRIADALEKIAEAQTVKLPYGLAEWRGCPGTDHDCVGRKLRDQLAWLP